MPQDIGIAFKTGRIVSTKQTALRVALGGFTCAQIDRLPVVGVDNQPNGLKK